MGTNELLRDSNPTNHSFTHGFLVAYPFDFKKYPLIDLPKMDI
jgi:hypothetical protein